MDSLLQTARKEDGIAKFGLNLWGIALQSGRDWQSAQWLLEENVHISKEDLRTLVKCVVSDDETTRLQQFATRLNILRPTLRSHILRLTLRAAAKAGDLRSVEKLMERARKWPLNDLSNLLCCSGHLAVKHGHADVAQYLIKHEDVRGNEPSLYNVFEIAAEKGLAELQNLLQQKTEFGKVCARAGNLTFLHLAAQSGSHPCLIQLLLNCPNIDVNAVSSPEGYTPLHVAAYYGHVNVVRLLLERTPTSPASLSTPDTHGASFTLDPLITDLQGRTALHSAAGQGWVEVVRDLLRTIEVDHRDYDGMTALHLAACAGHVAVVRELMLNSRCPGLEVHAFTSQKLLLQNVMITERLSGVAEFDAKTFSRPSLVRSVFWSLGGFTALHFAAVYGGQKVLEEVLKQDKIDILVEDDEGLTAYEWAEANGIGPAFLQYLDASNKGELKAQLMRRASFNVERAKSFFVEAKRMEHMKKELEWCYEMGKAVSCRQWVAAKGLVSQVPILKVKIDNPMWEFLASAFNMSRIDKGAEMANGAISQKDEEIVLLLLDADAFSTETLQVCLMWAIRENRVRVAEKLVFSTSVNCDKPTPRPKSSLFTVVREAGNTPLEYASRFRRLKIVKLLEEREDVKRVLCEDRRVYLDYANTILVVAVLIAGIAHNGWSDLAHSPEGSSDQPDFWFNRSSYYAFSFYLAMAAVVVGATAAMPTPTGKLVDTKMKMLIAVSVVSVLLLAAVGTVMMAFSLDYINARIMTARVLLFWTFLWIALLLWFVFRLVDLVTGIGILGLGSRFLLRPCVKLFMLPYEKAQIFISAYLPRNRQVIPTTLCSQSLPDGFR